jgi:hypothetical protein
MEHESFENENIAEIMNKYFVNIKGKHTVTIFDVFGSLTLCFSG